MKNSIFVYNYYIMIKIHILFLENFLFIVNTHQVNNIVMKPNLSSENKLKKDNPFQCQY